MILKLLILTNIENIKLFYSISSKQDEQDTFIEKPILPEPKQQQRNLFKRK